VLRKRSRARLKPPGSSGNITVAERFSLTLEVVGATRVALGGEPSRHRRADTVRRRGGVWLRHLRDWASLDVQRATIIVWP